MTVLPEAKLAREAEICYSTLAFGTGYNVSLESEDDLPVELVIANLMSNIAAARRLISDVVGMIPAECACSRESAMKNPIITHRSAIPERAIQRLPPIVSRYLS
jgi:5'-methylthioadenosine phosphorylase